MGISRAVFVINSRKLDLITEGIERHKLNLRDSRRFKIIYWQPRKLDLITGGIEQWITGNGKWSMMKD